MSFFFTNSFENEILVYIESYNKQAGTVLFDFIDSNEFNAFNAVANNNLSVGAPSMVFVTNYYLRPIQENTIYIITKETIAELVRNELLDQNQQDSFIIGYRLSLNNAISNLFTRSVSLNDFEKFTRGVQCEYLGNPDCIPSSINGNASFKIRDVEQGNWNELYIDEQVKIVYDAGAPVYANKAKVLAILEDRETVYKLECPGIFISHWDVDHYHSLVAMSDDTLSKFSYLFCRANLPTLTSRLLFNRFKSLLPRDRIFSIQAEPKIKGCVPLRLLSDSNNQILIFNAHEHKDRNRSGIILVIRTSKSNVIFSGDTHYYQLSDYVLPYINYPSKHYLVVPHHGGKAGTFIYNLRNKNKPEIAIISCGTNYYGHPLSKNIDHLRTIGFSLLNTNVVRKDIKVEL